MEMSPEEMQKFYELVDKVAPFTVFAEEENLEKIKIGRASCRERV